MEKKDSNISPPLPFNKIVQISSDSLNLDNKTLSASFKGSVIVIFNDLILKTNFLKIYYAENNGKRSIVKIEIPGKLKTFKKINNEIVVADKGEYIVASNELTLIGNVCLQKDENIVITNKMIYFTKLEIISKVK